MHETKLRPGWGNLAHTSHLLGNSSFILVQFVGLQALSVASVARVAAGSLLYLALYLAAITPRLRHSVSMLTSSYRLEFCK
jgi:hypothetical protein